MTRLYAASKAAGEATRVFLNMAAHELRTPITVLAGYLSMMGDGSLGRAPDSWAVPLQILKTKTGELNRIMESLVKASQIGAKVTPLQGQVIDLRNVVEAAVARARPRADLLHADISTKLAIGALPVNADKEELARVLDNLINNSLSNAAPPARLFIDASRDSTRALAQGTTSGVRLAE